MIGLATSLKSRKEAVLYCRVFSIAESLVVPSFQMRRGHPGSSQDHWNEVIQKSHSQTPRDFL